MDTPTISADSTPAALNTLGIGHPKAPRICLACGYDGVYSHNGQCVRCFEAAKRANVDAALAALNARIGEELELDHDDDRIPARRWRLKFPDGSPVALCSCPLEAVQAGEELL